MTIRSTLGGVRRKVLSSLHRRPASLGNCGPMVSFSFDDFPRSAYTVGGAILEASGVRGTYYAAAGLMNESSEVGELFHSDDLHSLLEKGHELGSHTFTHLSCRAVSASVFREDVKKGRNAIEKMAGIPCSNFAYPFGHVTVASKKSLQPELTSCRSIFPGVNGPGIDLNLLLANSLYGDLDQSKRAESLIAENARRRGWLIFYTHDVRPTPSDYGCTPELFEFAVASAVKSGARVLTVGKALTAAGLELATSGNGTPPRRLEQIASPPCN